jgi:hypothetical protein
VEDPLAPVLNTYARCHYLVTLLTNQVNVKTLTKVSLGEILQYISGPVG